MRLRKARLTDAADETLDQFLEEHGTTLSGYLEATARHIAAGKRVATRALLADARMISAARRRRPKGHRE